MTDKAVLRVLRPCEGNWGLCEIFADDPLVSQASETIYVPFNPNQAWGIFHPDGTAVMESVDRHGPDANTIGQILIAGSDILKDCCSSQGGTYIYGGVISLHYGHFIVNTLSRLWHHRRDVVTDAKIIFHGPGNPDVWFERPFLKQMFAAIGIYRENILTFDRPTRISTLQIPHPSFQEQHYICSAFTKLCNNIGNHLISSAGSVRRNDRPVYLSKTAMASGVGRVVNETVIENILRAQGVEIIYPESLTLRDQMMVFVERSIVLGITGSALHTSTFIPPRSRVIALSPTDRPNSNFSLMDSANGTKSEYYYAPGTQVVTEGNDRFLTNLELRDPELIARDLLVLMNS
jgi:capsular polysaccharide biosynthesis protein